MKSILRTGEILLRRMQCATAYEIAATMGGRISFHLSEARISPIGANIREANYAHGKADFIAKLQIALKECYETEYWLELFQRAGIADLAGLDPLRRASGTIRRMRIASLNTAKKNHT